MVLIRLLLGEDNSRLVTKLVKGLGSGSSDFDNVYIIFLHLFSIFVTLSLCCKYRK